MKQLPREVIRDLRRKQGMSQEDVAELVGCHACTISRIETGKSIPYRRNFERIFFGLGGYGINYENISEASGYLQDQLRKKVVEALERRDFESARQRLHELREFINIDDKFDFQLLYTLELVLARMEYGQVNGLREKFAEMLLISRSEDDLRDHPCKVWLTPVEMLILNNIALCYLDESNTIYAIEIFNLLIQNCENVTDIPLVEKTRAVLYNNLSLSYLKMNKPLMAIKMADCGIECLLSKGGLNHMLEILLIRAKACEMIGENEEAQFLRGGVKTGFYILKKGSQNWRILDDFSTWSRGICLL